MKKVFFVRNVNASWAIRDREILEQEYVVVDNFVSLVYYANPLWAWKLLTSDIIFCWFASISFYPIVLLAKITGKKVVIVSGGFDAAFAPSIGYGAFTKSKTSQWFRQKLFSLADKVLCVSKANMAETIVNGRVSQNRIEMLYHGFEPLSETVTLNRWESRKKQILLIGQCDHTTYYRKGVDNFLKLAKVMPEYEFVLVGRVEKNLFDFFESQASTNFRCTGFLSFQGQDFTNLLNESKFAMQLSRYESFGCAIVDAAVMGCYPIATSDYSLFEVVAGIGSIVTTGDIIGTRIEVLRVEEAGVDAEEISRQFLERFPRAKREESLLKCLK